MKTKLLKSMRMLLVAVLLGVGANAWGDVTPFSESYSSTSTTDGWSTATAGRFTPVILNEGDNYYLSVNQDQRNNNGTTVTGTVIRGKAAEGDDFTITFDMKLSSSNGNNAQAPVSFTIKDATNSGDFFSLTATGINVSTYAINGTSTQITLPNAGGVAIASCTWCSYKITRSGVYTYLTITNKATSGVIFSQAVVSGSSASGGLGNIVFVTRRYNANFAIDNIIVREVEATDIPSTYTAFFTDNTSGNNVSGTTTIYTDSERSMQIANGSLEDGETYYYTTTQTNYYDYQGSFTVDGAHPSVSFSMVHHPSYTINAAAGGSTIGTLASGYAAKDAGYSTYVPKAIKDINGCYYVLDDDDNANLSGYLASYTMGSTDEVQSVNYTLDASIVFYAEYEDISTGVSSYNYFEDRSSKGFSKALSGSNTMTTTMNTTNDGVYNVVLVGGNRDDGHTSTINMKLKASDGTVSESNVISQNLGGGQWVGEMRANNVLVPAGSEFYIVGDGNATNRFVIDYIIVRKVTDVENVNNEFVGAFDKSTASADDVFGSDIVLKKGEVKKITFMNHGADYGKNWMLKYSYGGAEVTTIRADWFWKYEGDGNASKRLGTYTVAYTSANGLNWDTWTTDMDNARVVLTVSNVNGMFAVDGTMTGESDTYYFKYSYDNSFDGDITLNLSVNLSWLEVLSIELTNVVASIGTYGYATFSSTYALDFTDVNDATAYIATSKIGDNIVLTSVTGKVAANTGLVLKSANGSSASVSIPVTDSGTTYNTTSETKNYLFAIDHNYELGTTDTGTIYVLTVQGDPAKVVFAPIGATSAAVKAGQAALWIPTAGTGARALNLVFDDEATGIHSIDNSQFIIDNYYNLNGQRVEKPAKGLYIVNGKKVLVNDKR